MGREVNADGVRKSDKDALHHRKRHGITQEPVVGGEAVVPVGILGEEALEASGFAEGEATAPAQPTPFLLRVGNTGHVQGGRRVGHKCARGVIGNYPVVEDACAMSSSSGYADGLVAVGAGGAVVGFAYVVFKWYEEIREGDGFDVRGP